MLQNRFVRFLLVGVVNTAFGLAIYSLVILAGAAIWIALLCSLIAGISFNFLTTGRLVFGDIGLSKFPRFVGCYALVYFTNLEAIHLLSRWIGDPIAAQVLLALPAAVLAYVLLKRLVFPSSLPRKRE